MMTTSGKPREVCCLQIARQYRNAWGGWREHKHNLCHLCQCQALDGVSIQL